MGIVTVMGIDPSLRNTGIAVAFVDTEQNKIVQVIGLYLARTQPGPKGQRKSSADYEAALVIRSEINKRIHEFNPKVVFAEIPSGSQSARGTMSAGISIGIMACTTPQPIGVTPQQVKLQSVGIRTATKGEMIAWGVETYPDAPWQKTAGGRVMTANEHLADAVATIHAGFVTPEWEVIKNLL